MIMVLKLRKIVEGIQSWRLPFYKVNSFHLSDSQVVHVYNQGHTANGTVVSASDACVFLALGIK